jgi:hypothetical protein
MLSVVNAEENFIKFPDLAVKMLAALRCAAGCWMILWLTDPVERWRLGLADQT